MTHLVLGVFVSPASHEQPHTIDATFTSSHNQWRPSLLRIWQSFSSKSWFECMDEYRYCKNPIHVHTKKYAYQKITLAQNATERTLSLASLSAPLSISSLAQSV
jgi:hypothetical protein